MVRFLNETLRHGNSSKREMTTTRWNTVRAGEEREQVDTDWTTESRLYDNEGVRIFE